MISPIQVVGACPDDLAAICGHERIRSLIDPNQPVMVLSSQRRREADMKLPIRHVAVSGHQSDMSTTLALALMGHEVLVVGERPWWLDTVRAILVPPCSTVSASAGHPQRATDADWSIHVGRLSSSESIDHVGRPKLSWPGSGTGLTVLDVSSGRLRLAGRYRDHTSWAMISTDHRQRSTHVRIPDDNPLNTRWPDWLTRLRLGTRLLNDGWTLVHAAAVRFPTPDGDRALLILADSAGGKSTLAHRACVERSAQLLADDLVVVKATASGVIVIGWPTRMCVPVDLLSDDDLRHLSAPPVVGTTVDGYVRRRMALSPSEYASRFGVRRAGPTRLGAVLVVRSTGSDTEPRIRVPLDPAGVEAALDQALRVQNQRLMMLDLLGIVGPAATVRGRRDATAPPDDGLLVRAMGGSVTVGLDIPTAAVLPDLPIWDMLADAWPPVEGEPR